MKYAFVQPNNRLVDVIETDPNIIFVSAYAEQFIVVPNEAEEGMVWDPETQTVSPYIKTPEELSAEIQQRVGDIFENYRTNILMYTTLGQPLPEEWKTYFESLKNLKNHVNYPNLNEEDWPQQPTTEL